MILKFDAPCGSTVSLDLSEKLGEQIEIDHLCFTAAPAEFRILRNGIGITLWHSGDTTTHNLQRTGLMQWGESQSRGHDPLQFFDRPHRRDVMTFGILTKGLALETRGLVGNFSLLVWPREGTFPQETCHGR